MARRSNPLLAQINRVTGVSRFTSGAATKNRNNVKKQMYNEKRRKSNGGKGG